MSFRWEVTVHHSKMNSKNASILSMKWLFLKIMVVSMTITRNPTIDKIGIWLSSSKTPTTVPRRLPMVIIFFMIPPLSGEGTEQMPASCHSLRRYYPDQVPGVGHLPLSASLWKLPRGIIIIILELNIGFVGVEIVPYSMVLQVGIIILTGYLVGLLAQKLGFPRVTGYILAGLLLNPYVLDFVIHRSIIGKNFQMSSSVLISLSLAIITFEVGGSLAIGAMKRLGKAVMYITIFEAEMAFLFVTLGLFTFFHFTGLFGGNARIDLAIALIIGALAAPTDPSATLAVMKEYKAHGEVSSMIMMVAAFGDD